MAHPFDFLKNLVSGAVVNETLRERLLFMKERFDAVAQENESLKKENAELVQRNQELEEQLPTQPAAEDFISHAGVLFKRTGGNVDAYVYCPKCRTVMCSVGSIIPFRCSDCHFLAPFNGQQLADVLKTVPAR